MLTVPNVGIEFDLSTSPYNKNTVSLGAKYNWGTYHKVNPGCVFDILEIRPEFRSYFRDVAKPDSATLKKIPSGIIPWLQYHLFATGRPWNVRYIGAYADYATYSFKFGQKGIQGQTVGLGISFGQCFPLYQYNSGAIDLDLGLSVGAMLSKYDQFEQSPVDYSYIKLDGESKSWHVVPFPMVTEVRVAFVWRKVSIKDKYSKTDPDYSKYLNNLNDVKYQFDTTIVSKKAFDENYWQQEFADSVDLYIAAYESFIKDQGTSLSVETGNRKYDRKLKKQIERNSSRAIRMFKDEVYRDRQAKEKEKREAQKAIESGNEKK